MAGGYNQLGYAKYYRLWGGTDAATAVAAIPGPTTEGHEVSLIFVPRASYVGASPTAVFNIIGYDANPLDGCLPNLASGAVVQSPAECDDPAGTPALSPAVVRVGGPAATGVTAVVAGVGCEVSFPCMQPFLTVAAVSGQTSAFDVILRIGRLRRARF